MTESTAPLDFVVRKKDWRECRFVPADVPDELESGQVLFRVDRFALTANNITYAVTGDMLGYWKFFPAGEDWGRLPVMGFGDVLRSRHPEVSEGDRFYGFYPISTHLVVQAGPNAAGLVDTVAHRQDTAPAYRQYTRAATDPLYDAQQEDRQMLLRGLFATSFLFDDFLAEQDFFGAECFVVSSASSKTSIALADRLSKRARGRVVGLTSPRNLSFVQRLGCYDEAVLYDELESLPADVPAVFADMSGDGDVVNRIHGHFGANLKHSAVIGATHWDSANRAEHLPGAAPTFFFAPAQIQKRSQEWGPREFQERLGGAFGEFVTSSADWLRVVRGHGPLDVERVYRDTLEGRTRPDEGQVLSLWERDAR
jgi:hypothetical protein